MSVHVVIVGATGAVGQEFLTVLAERKFPMRSLKLLASARSAGKKIEFDGKTYAVEQLTDVTHLQLPVVGKAVTAGQAFGEIESVKAVFDLNAPMTGTVSERNEAVAKDPSLINQDSYGKGWMIRIKLAAGAKTDHLLTLEQYEKQIAEGH